MGYFLGRGGSHKKENVVGNGVYNGNWFGKNGKHPFFCCINARCVYPVALDAADLSRMSAKLIIPLDAGPVGTYAWNGGVALHSCHDRFHYRLVSTCNAKVDTRAYYW
jgi:hypothetical protein